MIQQQGLNSAFPGRRRQPRSVYRTDVTCVIPGSAADSKADDRTEGNFTILKGWTSNVSEEGVCFVCPNRMTRTDLLVYLEIPGSECRLFEARIVNEKPISDGCWEYGAELKRYHELPVVDVEIGSDGTLRSGQ